ncbi:hypothetical protein JB92DRAFT_1908858 [Gautieria morchelliformis]|nr:hypothetical protein JB92DRAFT_1908858 [Gautieria morchelliformis]
MLLSNHSMDIILNKLSKSHGSDRNKQYEVFWEEEIQTPAHLQYTVHLLDLTTDDKQKLCLESGYDYIPRPQFRTHPPEFSLPVGHHICHVQLFQNNRCLLIISDDNRNLNVFLDNIDALNIVIKADHKKAVFSHTKLGSDVRIAVDEARALLILVSSDGSNACRLHIYRLMEKFSMFAACRTPMKLYSWHDGPLRITNACFVSGQEEIFLVDNREGRMYSFVTQQWRPATLHLIQQPSAIFSTPDGACLVAVERDQKRFHARVYHWASFGSNAGLVVNLADIQPTSFGITSLAQ